MKPRRPQVAVVLLAMLLAAACAKRPDMTRTAAPPPTGAAVTAAPPAAAAPVAPPATPPPPVAAPPSPTPRPAPADFKSIPALRDVFFDFDKHTIRPDAARVLDANVGWLKSNPSALILIEGHCDERGTNAYNLALGERRAKAAQEYFVARGVDAARIVIISYGEELPACTARNAACWAQNRRAHFLTKQP